MDDSLISYDDVVEYLFKNNKPFHAKRVMRMMEMMKELEGRLTAQLSDQYSAQTIEPIIFKDES